MNTSRFIPPTGRRERHEGSPGRVSGTGSSQPSGRGRRFALVVTLGIGAALSHLLLPGAASAQSGSGRSAPSLTLAEVVTAALEHHPSVRAATARLEAQSAQGRIARAARIPTLYSAGQFTRYQEPMVVAPFHGLDLTNPPLFDETLIQGQVGLQYTVFDGGARRARIRGADELRAMSESRREATRQDLIAQVSGAFLGVVQARRVREAARRQVEALAAERDRARQGLEQGTVARVAVLRADAALRDAEARLASAQARTGVAERNLSRLTGMNADDIDAARLTPPPPPAGEATPDHAESPAREVSAALEAASPELAAASSAVEAARSRVRQEKARLLPSLAADAGLMTFGSGGGDFTTEWRAGIQLSWPVFTGGARVGAIRRAEAEARAAREDLALARLEVAGFVDAARAAVEEADARARALAAAVAQWEEVARIEALSLREGAAVQSDYLRAEASLFQARAGLAGARNDQILARVRLARALGRLTPEWLHTSLEIQP